MDENSLAGIILIIFGIVTIVSGDWGMKWHSKKIYELFSINLDDSWMVKNAKKLGIIGGIIEIIVGVMLIFL